MTLKPNELDQYLLQTNQSISAEKRQAILDYFAEDPGDGQVWSEQDIWEQVRKMVCGNVSLQSPSKMLHKDIRTREILFRGKRVDNGEWVVGSLIPNDDTALNNVFIGAIVIAPENRYLGFWSVTGHALYEVYPDTVGQYTGLTDRNGKKIFEGDVLDTPRWVVTYFADIRESSGMNAGWYIQRDHFESWEELTCDNSHEVLGNIYDDPELFEVQS